MTRLLLTLLALLTGLAAQNAPASARVAAAEVTIQLPGSSKRTAEVQGKAVFIPVLAAWHVRTSEAITAQAPTQAPAVQISIDRARE